MGKTKEIDANKDSMIVEVYGADLERVKVGGLKLGTNFQISSSGNTDAANVQECSQDIKTKKVQFCNSPVDAECVDKKCSNCDQINCVNGMFCEPDKEDEKRKVPKNAAYNEDGSERITSKCEKFQTIVRRFRREDVLWGGRRVHTEWGRGGRAPVSTSTSSSRGVAGDQ